MSSYEYLWDLYNEHVGPVLHGTAGGGGDEIDRLASEFAPPSRRRRFVRGVRNLFRRGGPTQPPQPELSRWQRYAAAMGGPESLHGALILFIALAAFKLGRGQESRRVIRERANSLRLSISHRPSFLGGTGSPTSSGRAAQKAKKKRKGKQKKKKKRSGDHTRDRRQRGKRKSVTFRGSGGGGTTIDQFDVGATTASPPSGAGAGGLTVDTAAARGGGGDGPSPRTSPASPEFFSELPDDDLDEERDEFFFFDHSNPEASPRGIDGDDDSSLDDEDDDDDGEGGEGGGGPRKRELEPRLLLGPKASGIKFLVSTPPPQTPTVFTHTTYRSIHRLLEINFQNLTYTMHTPKKQVASTEEMTIEEEAAKKKKNPFKDDETDPKAAGDGDAKGAGVASPKHDGGKASNFAVAESIKGGGGKKSAPESVPASSDGGGDAKKKQPPEGLASSAPPVATTPSGPEEEPFVPGVPIPLLCITNVHAVHPTNGGVLKVTTRIPRTEHGAPTLPGINAITNPNVDRQKKGVISADPVTLVSVENEATDHVVQPPYDVLIPMKDGGGRSADMAGKVLLANMSGYEVPTLVGSDVDVIGAGAGDGCGKKGEDAGGAMRQDRATVAVKGYAPPPGSSPPSADLGQASNHLKKHNYLETTQEFTFGSACDAARFQKLVCSLNLIGKEARTMYMSLEMVRKWRCLAGLEHIVTRDGEGGEEDTGKDESIENEGSANRYASATRSSVGINVDPMLTVALNPKRPKSLSFGVALDDIYRCLNEIPYLSPAIQSFYSAHYPPWRTDFDVEAGYFYDYEANDNRSATTGDKDISVLATVASRGEDGQGGDSRQYMHRRNVIGFADFLYLWIGDIPPDAVPFSTPSGLPAGVGMHRLRTKKAVLMRKRVARAALYVRSYVRAMHVVCSGWKEDADVSPRALAYAINEAGTSVIATEGMTNVSTPKLAYRLSYDDDFANMHHDSHSTNEYYEATVGRDVKCDVHSPEHLTRNGASVESKIQGYSLVGCHVYDLAPKVERSDSGSVSVSGHDSNRRDTTSTGTAVKLSPQQDPVLCIDSLFQLIASNPTQQFFVMTFFPGQKNVAVVQVFVRTLPTGVDRPFDTILDRFACDEAHPGESTLRNDKLEVFMQLGPSPGLSPLAWAALKAVSAILAWTRRGEGAIPVKSRDGGQERTQFPGMTMSSYMETRHFGRNRHLCSSSSTPQNYLAVTAHIDGDNISKYPMKLLYQRLEDGALNNSVVDFTFVLEGQDYAELPERALASVRMCHVDAVAVALCPPSRPKLKQPKEKRKRMTSFKRRGDSSVTSAMRGAASVDAEEKKADEMSFATESQHSGGASRRDTSDAISSIDTGNKKRTKAGEGDAAEHGDEKSAADRSLPGDSHDRTSQGADRKNDDGAFFFSTVALSRDISSVSATDAEDGKASCDPPTPTPSQVVQLEAAMKAAKARDVTTLTSDGNLMTTTVATADSGGNYDGTAAVTGATRSMSGTAPAQIDGANTGSPSTMPPSKDELHRASKYRTLTKDALDAQIHLQTTKGRKLLEKAKTKKNKSSIWEQMMCRCRFELEALLEVLSDVTVPVRQEHLLHWGCAAANTAMPSLSGERPAEKETQNTTGEEGLNGDDAVVDVPVLHNMTAHDLFRFLVASDYNLKTAAVRLVESAAWRGITFPIDKRLCRVELQSGQFFQQGKDRIGRPVFYFRNMCLGPWRKDVDASVLAVLHRLESALSTLSQENPAVRCTLVILVSKPVHEEPEVKPPNSKVASNDEEADHADIESSLKGEDSDEATVAGHADASKQKGNAGVLVDGDPRVDPGEDYQVHSNLQMEQQLYQVLSRHYPERLGKALVVPKSKALGMWDRLRAHVPQLRTRSRVILLNSTDDLKHYIDEDELVNFAGGKATVDMSIYSC